MTEVLRCVDGEDGEYLSLGVRGGVKWAFTEGGIVRRGGLEKRVTSG